MAGIKRDLTEVIEDGQDHVAQATIAALTDVQRALRESDLEGEDQVATLLHAATVFAVESLRLVVRQLGQGSAADYDDAVREMLMQVCQERRAAAN